jgi:NAD(P)H-flavin reductase
VTPTAASATGIDPRVDPYFPHMAAVRLIEPECPRVATFQLEFLEPDRNQAFAYRPGQFNMIYVPGVGEVAISISGAPDMSEGLRHTVRFVGRVTDVLGALQTGAVVGLRGPYGTGWPMESCEGRDVVLVAGGLGLAPLRPAVMWLLAARERYGRLTLLYGSRQPSDLLYSRDFDDWQRRGLDVIVTVDRALADWRGHVGVVPVLFRTLTLDPASTVVMICGPEIMMRLTIAEARARRIDDADIYVSLERNMQCAVGLCGHCQLGPEFVCMDGPVFPFRKVARFLGKEHF